jgi:WXXGXW repeat (2 copies)
MKPLMAACVIAISLVTVAACADVRGRVFVRVGPPPPRVEAVVAAPGPGYVWVPGYYRWDGAVYVWTPGRYLRPPRPRARWVAGHWVHNRRGWYYVEGRWR